MADSDDLAVSDGSLDEAEAEAGDPEGKKLPRSQNKPVPALATLLTTRPTVMIWPPLMALRGSSGAECAYTIK